MTALPDVLTQVGPYPVKWVGCHPDNRFSNQHPRSIEGVVCHTMGGYLAGCDSWFNNPAAQASANFGIGRNGEIHQYVRLWTEAPYANGVSQNSTAKVAAMDTEVRRLSEQYGWQSQNLWTWSIEHEDARQTTQITDHQAMFDASTWLCATLLSALPVDRRRTWGHYQFDAIDRKYCPGWTTDTWQRYDARVWEILAEIERDPTPAPPPATPAPDLTRVKALMDEGYNAAFAAMNQSAAAFAKWEELFVEMRAQFPGGGI